MTQTETCKGFCLMLLGLKFPELASEPNFCFIVKEGVAVLRACRLTIQGRALKKQYSIKYSHKKATKFIRDFVQGRLLVAQLGTKLDENCSVQPTAKGFAVLQKFCQENAVFSPNSLSLMCSLYNSMELIELPRTSDGALKHSLSLSLVIWRHMLGNRPNIYKADSDSEMITSPTIKHIAGAHATGLEYESKPATGPSPYFNRFLAHPSSNYGSQYYTSTAGVRLFENIRFTGGKEQTIDLCVSGKAMWQWIMDCTDTICFQEAALLVQSFVELKLVIPIEGKVLDGITTHDDMPQLVSRETFYRFSKRHSWASSWGDSNMSLGQNIEAFESVMSAIDSTASRLAIPRDLYNEDADLQRAYNNEIYTLYTSFRTVDLDDNFLKVASLNVILQEGGLLVLFRKFAREAQALETLRYLEEYKTLELEIARLNERKEVIVSKHAYDTVFKRLASIIYRFILVHSPQEINISQEERETALSAFFETARLVPPPLTNIQVCLFKTMRVLVEITTHQETVLQSVVTQFIQKTYICPAIKRYVAAQQIYQSIVDRAIESILIEEPGLGQAESKAMPVIATENMNDANAAPLFLIEKVVI